MRGQLLQALDNIQPAAAPVALHGIGRIGHHLQFAQNKLRNDDDPVQEAGIGDVGDAAIDKDTGVEDLRLGSAAGIGPLAVHSRRSDLIGPRPCQCSQ